MNLYILILGLFTVTGVLTALWGWIIIARGRKTRRWPVTDGLIEKSTLAVESDELLPHIEFSYTVAGRSYTHPVKFPSDVTPTAEFSRHYLEKYPAGAQVQVHYHPSLPEHATIEPGLGRGDWMVFALGVAATAFGILALLLSTQ